MERKKKSVHKISTCFCSNTNLMLRDLLYDKRHTLKSFKCSQIYIVSLWTVSYVCIMENVYCSYFYRVCVPYTLSSIYFSTKLKVCYVPGASIFRRKKQLLQFELSVFIISDWFVKMSVCFVVSYTYIETYEKRIMELLCMCVRSRSKICVGGVGVRV